MKNFAPLSTESSLKKPWYKTGGGVTLLVVFLLLSLVGLAFAGLVGYYAWEIKQGRGGAISEQINSQKFSVDSSLASASSQKALGPEEVKQYIRKSNPGFGKETATITVIAFYDFLCPHCQESAAAFRSMMQKYEPVVRVVFKQLPLESLHAGATDVSLAAACAQEQGGFWTYFDLIFKEKQLGMDVLLNQAKQAGLSADAFSLCLATEKHQGVIVQDLKDAMALGVRGTPTYFLNGYKIEGVLTNDDWDQLILSVLQSKK